MPEQPVWEQIGDELTIIRSLKMNFEFQESENKFLQSPEDSQETPRMPGLTEIAAAYHIGLDLVEASAEEMTDEQFDSVAESESSLHEKIGNYGVALKIHKREMEYFKAQAKIFKAMADELTQKAVMIENASDRKRIRLKEVMDHFEIRKVKGPHATVSVADLAPSVEVVSETLALETLPPKFIRTVRTIDKTPLLAALKINSAAFSEMGVTLKTGSTIITVR